jgi:hypothetical protein
MGNFGHLEKRKAFLSCQGFEPQFLGYQSVAWPLYRLRYIGWRDNCITVISHRFVPDALNFTRILADFMSSLQVDVISSNRNNSPSTNRIG